jgi:hypothetical protein
MNMKPLLSIAVFLLAFVAQVVAQTNTSSKLEVDARLLTEQLTAKYGLNGQQSDKMFKIQVRKLKNTQDVEALKATDMAKYHKKRKSLQRGTLGSIQLVLNSEEQRATFQKTQAEVRQLKAAKRKELAKSGKSKQDIENDLLDIYQE